MEEEERTAPRMWLRRAKIETSRRVTALGSFLKRRHYTLDVPRRADSDVRYPHSQLTDTQTEERDTRMIAFNAPGKQQNPVAKNTEQGARESEEVERLRQDLSESRAQIARLEKRCEAQSRDSQGTNNFLHTADKSSDSDIIRVLQKLNAEVQQNTTYMADFLAEYFEFQNVTRNPTDEQVSAGQRISEGLLIKEQQSIYERQPRKKINEVVDDFRNPTDEQMSAEQRVSKYIGQNLAKSLATNTREDIPMLLQTAFQAYLASALTLAASSWASEKDHNTFVYGIYQKLRSVGEEINVRMRLLLHLTSRKNGYRGASYFWTLACARAPSHQAKLACPTKISRRRSPHKHF
jgi:hypothetical protein